MVRHAAYPKAQGVSLGAGPSSEGGKGGKNQQLESLLVQEARAAQRCEDAERAMRRISSLGLDQSGTLYRGLLADQTHPPSPVRASIAARPPAACVQPGESVDGHGGSLRAPKSVYY